MGAWEGGPVGPGPPPLGSWGASQGLPGGGARPQTTRPTSRHFPSSTLQIRITIYVDFDDDFWSFWGRSWVPLGVMLGSCWRLFRPKWVLDPSSNCLIIEIVICHETLRFPMFVGQDGPQDGAKIDPRSLQDGSKIVLGRLFFVLIFRFDF